jgi:GNAT superfamily N-acetyltransferase
MSGRELLSLTLDRLDDLPDPCRTCLFWELDPVLAQRAHDRGDPELDKESWVSAALLEWGSVGRVAYVDGAPAGYVTYAPAYLVPRAAGFPTAPVSGDAVLLMTAAVAPEHSGSGLGRMLVQAAAKDLHRRNVRAMEAFGRSGPVPRQLGGCVLPASFLCEVGFKTVREHAVWPRMRLDLRTVASWREDMEAAVERLLQQVRQPVLTRGPQL